MGKIKEELMQLESDISNAQESLEKILDIKLDDEDIQREIFTNPIYLEFIQMWVKDKGLSKFNSPKDVKDYIDTELKKEGGN